MRLLPYCFALLLIGCSSTPDKPLPRTWHVPGIGHEVLRKGLNLSQSEAEVLARQIAGRLQEKWDMDDDYTFQTLSHSDGHLTVNLNQSSGVFAVELKKVFGKWRIWRLKEPFYEHIDFSEK